ncbi:MAG: diacylglycerol kinase family lipid kinase [Christensenellaceae bacterium]|nr:diacylglycerol kinase family lipid kinase [Christensenellaceae bacterium]
MTLYAFIVNPAAGSGRARKALPAIEAEMHRRGVGCRVLLTEYPGHATELAKAAAMEAGCEGVIAVGGDGTAYEVACGLLDSAVPMGIIPVGTGNDFIKTIGTPRSMQQALEFILTHPARPVDVGQLNDRLFLNVSGTGFDVAVLECMEDAKKVVRGIWPYLIGVIRAIFRYRPVHVSWTVDGEAGEQDVLLCAVANGRYIGGGIPICLEAAPDDGLLDLVLVENKPRWMIPFYLPGLLMGRVLRFPFTKHQRCREVTMSSPGMHLNVDGEVQQVDQVRFSVLPGRLMMFW